MKSRVHPKYKTQYHVGNWPAYDRALVQCGDITVWLAPDAIATWEAVGVGKRGGPRQYSDLAIETALTLRLIFHLPLRQTEGFLTSIFGMLGLDLSAPDHTTLSRRGQHLDLPLRRAPAGAGLHLIVDSTSLSIVGEGEWAAAKHGGRGRRGWKKLHLGVDRSGVIVARALTEASVDDATTGITLIEATDGALGRVTADAAYDTIGFYEAAGARGATVVVPPTRTANVSRYGSRQEPGLVRQTAPASTDPIGPQTQTLLEEVLRRENLRTALKRVQSNKGAPGVDGMRVEDLPAYLRTAWHAIREQRLDASYSPSPVREVRWPKPGGGTRMLGIPTVLDRFMTQAILQVLSPLFDPGFSDHSYGVRPGRSALHAVGPARDYISRGHRWVVDLDVEKFFDQVNHDMLVSRVARKVKDTRLLKRIRRYLNAGIMKDGMVSIRHAGTPQGSPLSPRLSNILLDDFDKELERRGHGFCRYADDGVPRRHREETGM